MDGEIEIRENRGILERSLSYSEAINSTRQSIEIPKIINTNVYTNENLKKFNRISQTYVEGKEIIFPITNYEDFAKLKETAITDDEGESSEDENDINGLMLKIDDNSTAVNDVYEAISDDYTRARHSPSTAFYMNSSNGQSDFNDVTSAPDTNSTPNGYCGTYTKQKNITHRRKTGRPRGSRRVVLKTGEENVPVRSNIPAKSIKYMRDIVNTVINSKWRYLLMMMVIAHFALWLLFATIWYFVTSSYQDDIGDGKEHCVIGTSSFAGLLMMAVETQMTIGYGVRYPNEECPEAIIIMVLELIAGTALSGGLSSLLFTKLVRPNRHVTSVGFSQKATVCLRDGELCLQFRVWDLLNLHLIGTSITAYMLKPIKTLEGELVNNYIHQLELAQSKVFMLWPITVVHVINEKSPLYELSAQDMMENRFEIVVCLTGSSKNMGTVTQSRTSYLSKEINWGYRFSRVLHYSKKEKSYIIDVEKLNTIEQVDTPLCSASQLKEFTIQTDSPIYASPESIPTTSQASAVSTPVFSRHGTQKSFGWSFKRFSRTLHEETH